MAFDDPRPSSQPEGSTDLAVAKDNLILLDKMAVSDELSVDNRKGQPRKTFAGIEAEADQRITDAVIAAGYTVIGDFADVVKVAINNPNEVYTSKSVPNYENVFWLTNQTLPYTPTGSDPTAAPELGKFKAVNIAEIETTAIALNVPYSEVIADTDGITPLGGKKYIRAISAQTTWATPGGVGAGEIIVSVVGDQLETNVSSPLTYTLGAVGSTTQTPASIGWTDDKNGPKIIYDAILSGVDFEIPARLTSFDRQLAQWSAVEAANYQKAPIAIFGDSTTDGRVTTTDGTTPVSVYNISRLVGDKVPDGLVYDHDDAEVPNAYPNILQRLLREFTTNPLLRIYNAGYRGKQVVDGWALENIYNAVYGNATYRDCEMIGINFGLNDSNFDSGPSLYTDTYNYTKAIVLDAYARGIQPFLMTCNMTAKTVDGDYGHNEQVVQMIDTVKFQLAKEFELEVVDMNSAMKDFIGKNNDAVGFSNISPDDLHVNDLGHLFQAQYFLKFILKTQMPTVGNVRVGFDAGHSAMRGSVTSAALSGSDPDRGANKVLRNYTLSTSQLNAIANTNIVDLFVWNEGRRTDFIFRAQTPANSSFFLITDKTEVPQIIVESRFLTAGEFYLNSKYSDAMPDYLSATETNALNRPFQICKLDYGLNRIRIYVPSNIASQTALGYAISHWFGSFDFIPHSSEHRRTLTQYTYNASHLDLTPFKNVLADSGPIVHPNLGLITKPNAYDSHAIPESDSGANIVSMCKNGDYYEIQAKAAYKLGTGVLLGYNLIDNSSLSAPSGFNKDDVYMFGSSFILYTRGGIGTETLAIALLSQSNGIVFFADTLVDATLHENKYLTIRATRNTINSVTIKLFDQNMTELHVFDIDNTDQAGYFASWVVGGSWINETLAVESSVVESISCRNIRS